MEEVHSEKDTGEDGDNAFSAWRGQRRFSADPANVTTNSLETSFGRHNDTLPAALHWTVRPLPMRPGRRCNRMPRKGDAQPNQPVTVANSAFSAAIRRDEADRASRDDNRHFKNLPGMYFRPAFRRNFGLHAGSTSEYFFFAGISDIGVDQRQNDIKVLNMFRTSAATTYLKGSSMVIYAPTIDMEAVGSTSRNRRHGCTIRLRGHFAEDIFISDKVLRLAEDQRADGVKRLSLPIPFTFGQQETSGADDHWRTRICFEEYRQRGNKDDRAQYFQEEETPNLDRSYCQRRSLCTSLANRAVFPTSRRNLQAKANIRVQENRASNTSITSN